MCLSTFQAEKQAALEPDLSGGLPGLVWAQPGSGPGDSSAILSLPLLARDSLP